MHSKAQDTDIQATSSKMSLSCPVSTRRIDVPCRSTICSHNQCYDAQSFLQLQEQAPTWTCPVCGKIVGFEALTIDQYVCHTIPSISRTKMTADTSTISSNRHLRRSARSRLSPTVFGGRSRMMMTLQDREAAMLAVTTMRILSKSGTCPDWKLLRTRHPIPC